MKKVWDDSDDQDGKRPSSLKVTLSSGEEVTLNEANAWTAAVTDLPKYDKGKAIVYTWSEEPIDGYELSGNITEGTVTTLTNTHTPETTEASVMKIWDDDHNRDGKRPQELIFTLSNNQTVTLNEANEWRAVIRGLPKYKDGSEIEYTWSEGAVPQGYSITDIKTEGTMTTFTDSYIPGKVSAVVKKVWDDNDNQDGIRPAVLTVVLKRNGETMTSYELSDQNEWSAVAANLPEYSEGVKNDYTWEETSVPAGYTSNEPEKSGTQTIITNVHVPAETSASVKKIWDDGNNQDGKRPASLKVTLSSGSEVTLNDANDWSAKIEHLPKYRKGEEIEYTWSEEPVEGYELSGNTKEGTVTTLTNTHTPETTEATVKKIWDDNDNQDGKRPDSVVMNLLKNGEILRTVILSSAGLWTGTVTGLDKYAKGKEVEYTWEEKVIPEGYVPDHPKKEGTVTTITNRRIRGALIVSKKLLDGLGDDRDKKFEFTVKLGAAISGTYGEIVFEDGKAVVSLKGGESVMAENLPTGISYTVTEKQGPGYELTEKKGDTGVIGETASSASFVNRRITGSLTVVKTWSGGSHEKDNVEVTLYQNGNEIRKVVLNRACDWTNVWTISRAMTSTETSMNIW